MPNNIMATKIFVLNPRALKTLEEVDDVLDLHAFLLESLVQKKYFTLL